MAKLKILGIAGALRSGSTNKLLMREAARLLGDVELTEADLNLPLYDGDLEERAGVPDEVRRLGEQISQADAVIISTPEYNKGITGVMKNALDWVSRVEGNPWDGKPVAIMSAAAGRAGGERSQLMLRECILPFSPRLVFGPEIAVHASFEAFDEKGELKGELYSKNLSALMDKLRAML